jgi:hypothetical protein
LEQYFPRQHLLHIFMRETLALGGVAESSESDGTLAVRVRRAKKSKERETLVATGAFADALNAQRPQRGFQQ